MVNWEAVEQWRDELRSGKYKQGKDNLRRGDKYCCLGVFCETVAKIQPKINYLRFSYENQMGALPDSARALLGCHVGLPELFGTYASILNDVGIPYEGIDSLTFDEIADLLDIALIEREGID